MRWRGRERSALSSSVLHHKFCMMSGASKQEFLLSSSESQKGQIYTLEQLAHVEKPPADYNLRFSRSVSFIPYYTHLRQYFGVKEHVCSAGIYLATFKRCFHHQSRDSNWSLSLTSPPCLTFRSLPPSLRTPRFQRAGLLQYSCGLHCEQLLSKTLQVLQ